jgi:hypothetical protein
MKSCHVHTLQTHSVNSVPVGSYTNTALKGVNRLARTVHWRPGHRSEVYKWTFACVMQHRIPGERVKCSSSLDCSPLPTFRFRKASLCGPHPLPSQIRLHASWQTLTDDFQVADLTLHGVRVDLTHVPSTVGLPYISYMQIPCPVITVCHTNAMIFGDHMTGDRKDGLSINSKPCDLK